jgi:glycosyltransferase involved in cell wall biosynthesis
MMRASFMTKRVAIVVSHPGTARAFLSYQLSMLSRNYHVSVVANARPGELAFLPEDVRPFSVRLERRPAPIRDLLALFALYRLFRRERFDLVHSMTPKAGLLAMLAAFASRVPVRLHTFMGEVWATHRGWSRWLLKNADRLTATLATDVLVVSPSERDFLRAEGVLNSQEGRVLASGSVSGVDIERFAPDPEVRRSVREELGIGDEEVVFLFLGRLARDKGVLQLMHAWQRIVPTRMDGYLVVVGPDEENLLALPALRETQRTVIIDQTWEPERYLKAADVLCLPSRREGFPNVILEAASAAVPAIASRIYGVIDAVVDGETGLLVPVDDVDSLTACMLRLLDDPDIREKLGEAARERAVAKFSQGMVAEALRQAYADALASL